MSSTRAIRIGVTCFRLRAPVRHTDASKRRAVVPRSQLARIVDNGHPSRSSLGSASGID
jgi:hypothetical protein